MRGTVASHAQSREIPVILSGPRGESAKRPWYAGRGVPDNMNQSH